MKIEPKSLVKNLLSLQVYINSIFLAEKWEELILHCK